MNVAVQEYMLESAPVHVQSDVRCQPADGVMEGAVSEDDQTVTLTVWTPAVESDATGSPFIVAGEMSAVASKSHAWSTSEEDSAGIVNAPNVFAWRAGDTAMLSTA